MIIISGWFSVALLMICGLASSNVFAIESHGTGGRMLNEFRQSHNSSSFINVTQADGHYVTEPLMSSDLPDIEIANQNTRRMHAIMHSDHISSRCLIFFPPGSFYFNGAVEGAKASIESTKPYQSFVGSGMNATRILQCDLQVSSTMRLGHDGCSIQDLFIGSGDQSTHWNQDWENSPHVGAAIYLDAPVSDWKKWTTDPVVTNVNINSLGNTIALHGYCRPFMYGIRITGSWLNILIDTLWMTDLYTAIHVDQGPVMAGPAKIMNVNFYSTHEREHSKVWSVFFRSENNFMEQVELIHCTFIGAQFISMEADAEATRPSNTTPCYDMVIDHNYINVVDTFAAPQAQMADPRFSGIYMALPCKRTSDGEIHYSRDIRFTNNSCTGRSPARGAFLYFSGMCRGITISQNDISSALADICIRIVPDSGLNENKSEVKYPTAMQDVKITENYFRTWKSLVNIGPDEIIYDDGDSQSEVLRHASGRMTRRVVISDNQCMFEGNLNSYGSDLMRIALCEDVAIHSNTLSATAGSALVLAHLAGGSVTANSFRGLRGKDSGDGIKGRGIEGLAIVGNAISGFEAGISLTNASNTTLGNNILKGNAIGVSVARSKSCLIQNNIASECNEDFVTSSCLDVSIRDNCDSRSNSN